MKEALILVAIVGLTGAACGREPSGARAAGSARPVRVPARGLDLPDDVGVVALRTRDDFLYLTTWNARSGTRFYRSRDGADWSPLNRGGVKVTESAGGSRAPETAKLDPLGCASGKRIEPHGSDQLQVESPLDAPLCAQRPRPLVLGLRSTSLAITKPGVSRLPRATPAGYPESRQDGPSRSGRSK